jgi:KipI family sensor histidine kinase inhibitor
MKPIMDIYPASERSLCVEFGQTISPDMNDLVQNLAGSLRDKPVFGVLDIVPAYASLLVCFDPMRISSSRLTGALRRRAKKTKNATLGVSATIYIPVCYQGDFAPDMKTVCAHTGFSEAEIIERHTKPVYRIYMLGFMPGFPYLGGLDPALETPRLKTPRTKIPAGAVGIGGAQTGIYPSESPGSWQLIGQTPVKLYDPSRTNNPVLYGAGDTIVFYSVSVSEYERIAREVALGVFVCKRAAGEKS